jgi:hypothetical protein
MLKDETGSPISALAISSHGVAWGDEGGGAGIAPLPSFA